MYQLQKTRLSGPLHQASASTLRQFYNDSSRSVLIENNYENGIADLETSEIDWFEIKGSGSHDLLRRLLQICITINNILITKQTTRQKKTTKYQVVTVSQSDSCVGKMFLHSDYL